VAQASTSAGEPVTVANTAADVLAEHADFIRAIIRSRVRDDSAADDVFQDFFLSLISNPPPPIVNMKSYLYKALMHDIVDAQRREVAYRKHVKRRMKRDWRRTDTETPDNALIEIEEANRILDIIGTIVSRRQAQAVTLRYATGCSIGEIADEMDVDNRTVSRHICLAMRKICRFFSVAWDSCDDHFGQ
jgi:RNA polymerase sigma factor (sigma-70 family)